jgi:hypothetical protein
MISHAFSTFSPLAQNQIETKITLNDKGNIKISKYNKISDLGEILGPSNVNRCLSKFNRP